MKTKLFPTMTVLVLAALCLNLDAMGATSPSQLAAQEEANCAQLKKNYATKYSETQFKTVVRQTIEQVYFGTKSPGVTVTSDAEKTVILQLAKCNKLIDDSFLKLLNKKIEARNTVPAITPEKTPVAITPVRPATQTVNEVKPAVVNEIKVVAKEEKTQAPATPVGAEKVTPKPIQEKQDISNDPMKERFYSSSEYTDEATCTKIEKTHAQKYNKSYYKNLLKNKSLETITSELKSPNGNDIAFYEQMNILKYLRCNKLIDDVVFNLVQTKLSQDKDQVSETPRNLPAPSMELSTYLEKKVSIVAMTSLKLDQETANPFPFKKFPAALNNNNQKVTVLERLYALYSPEQIKKMAQLMDLTLNVIDASEVETKIIFRRETNREDYIVGHSASDIYRLALRIFTMEKKKLLQEYNGSGLPFSNLDILAAASVMGVVSNADINILTSDESFYKKEKSFVKKIGGYLLKIGLTSAQINPATAPYALVGIILYNSYQEINQAKEKIEFENFYFN